MATTSVETLLATWGATDAGFRIWATAWHDTLIALGLTQEYSNIDLTTVTMPTNSQTEAGARVYALNDSLSGTREIYLRVGWGRGSTTSGDYGFRISLTIGTTHSSGTVGGYGFSGYITCQHGSLADGGLVGARTETGIVLFTNVSHSTNLQTGFMLERTAKAGTPNTQGYVLLYFGQTTDTTGTSANESAMRAVNIDSGTVYPRLSLTSTTFSMNQVASSGSAMSYLSKAPLLPIATFGDNDPLLNLVISTYEQRTAGTIFSATVNGVAGTYRIPKNLTFAPSNGGCALKVAD